LINFLRKTKSVNPISPLLTLTLAEMRQNESIQ